MTIDVDVDVDRLMHGGMSIIPNLRVEGMVNIAIHHDGDYFCIDFTRDQLKKLIIDLERIANDTSW